MPGVAASRCDVVERRLLWRRSCGGRAVAGDAEVLADVRNAAWRAGMAPGAGRCPLGVRRPVGPLGVVVGGEGVRLGLGQAVVVGEPFFRVWCSRSGFSRRSRGGRGGSG